MLIQEKYLAILKRCEELEESSKMAEQRAKKAEERAKAIEERAKLAEERAAMAEARAVTAEERAEAAEDYMEKMESTVDALDLAVAQRCYDDERAELERLIYKFRHQTDQDQIETLRNCIKDKEEHIEHLQNLLESHNRWNESDGAMTMPPNSIASDYELTEDDHISLPDGTDPGGINQWRSIVTNQNAVDDDAADDEASDDFKQEDNVPMGSELNATLPARDGPVVGTRLHRIDEEVESDVLEPSPAEMFGFFYLPTTPNPDIVITGETESDESSDSAVENAASDNASGYASETKSENSVAVADEQTPDNASVVASEPASFITDSAEPPVLQHITSDAAENSTEAGWDLISSRASLLSTYVYLDFGDSEFGDWDHVLSAEEVDAGKKCLEWLNQTFDARSCIGIWRDEN
ncbi:hypothetical protein EDB81DRAFT_763870 [Dactylonectria macrodidyma]|uniref:Uncharacterized protein n=1 Tax=Dactylonectria macrodidyma TaxID=307937 RepID=A0A9P9E758_9HYPO|nr:hypothetical protein EDB81DRAFT_763870 [Dactylonectria macrodidyma]